MLAVVHHKLLCEVGRAAKGISFDIAAESVGRPNAPTANGRLSECSVTLATLDPITPR